MQRAIGAANPSATEPYARRDSAGRMKRPVGSPPTKGGDPSARAHRGVLRGAGEGGGNSCWSKNFRRPSPRHAPQHQSSACHPPSPVPRPPASARPEACPGSGAGSGRATARVIAPRFDAAPRRLDAPACEAIGAPGPSPRETRAAGRRCSEAALVLAARSICRAPLARSLELPPPLTPYPNLPDCSPIPDAGSNPSGPPSLRHAAPRNGRAAPRAPTTRRLGKHEAAHRPRACGEAPAAITVRSPQPAGPGAALCEAAGRDLRELAR